MSLIPSPTQSKITHLLAIFVLGLGYFNYILISEPIIAFFQISSLIGQVLVNKFLTICNYIFDVIELTFLFFQILYEDALIFLKDATEKFTFALHLLKELFLFLEQFGWNVLKTVFQFVEITVNILELIQSSTEKIKQGIYFLGSSIWNFFTGIPETVICYINEINEFLRSSVSEIKNSIFKLFQSIVEKFESTYLFLFDVPLDSVYGLIIGTVLMTIIGVKFKDICYFVRRVFLKLSQQVISIGISLWQGRFLEQKSRSDVNNISEDLERLCIVCQFHLRDIIIFPCKHLCLCVECSRKLRKNQAKCPLCRSDIRETLKVYL